ncbi:MAG: signal recognition particle protein [Verrucomicrobiales bacterium]|jgi:signal recognition particle subunit SRP54|nr:signal recognition particle protein [Verrucomicrobiales bacterium]MDP4790446.1 signal recognition particle protein [Verrucomicrobiales bacterium]MDP5007330.1 signal recognition particle protein [Verrucomicrobiales bacterium]
MFSNLSDNLQETFKKLRGHGKITEKNISDSLREVRLALLEADVEFSVAKDFIARIKEKALGETVLRSIQPGQQIVKIFNDEIAALLGGDAAPLDLNPPSRLLIVGLNGAGKTTTSAKLALHLRKEGRRPLLVACDLYRPAAIDQLVTLGKQIDIPVFRPEPGESDVLKVAQAALKWAEDQGGTVTIFDTAGRQEVDEALIEELKQLHRFLAPRETLLVADSATGQQAVNVAKTFDEIIGITGIVLTKLDGDARGGAALSMRSVTGKPIKFAGVGEKLSDFEAFVPDRMAGRILGMGDIVGLVERAAEAIDEDEALRMAERMKGSNFDFNDFLAQMRMMNRMGGMQSILGMLPGMGEKLKGVNLDEKRMKRTEAIVLSMTPKERTRPEIIKASRRRRIALGSGVSVTQVNQLLKQFGQMRKMMRSKGKMSQMMKQFGGGKMPF